MINLYHYKGFALRRGDSSSEAGLLHLYCLLNRIPLIRKGKEKIPPEYVPSGSVEWCEFQLGKHIIPDYYPGWLSGYFDRKIWRETHWPLGKKIFIKPADRYKRFNGFVTDGTYKGKKRGPYWCSEVVSFINEWRYYVIDGKIVSNGWYAGDETNTPAAPELSITTPKNFCGALDFGQTKNGKLLLVECEHPFACGWYNKDAETYAQWLIAGWNYMNKNL